MGSTLLRLVTAGLLGILVAVGDHLAGAPAPGEIGAPVWGIIVAGAKLVIDFIVAQVGPKPTATTTTSGGSGHF